MTPEEKAVAIVELRLLGMHPEWIKWFVWFRGGYFVSMFRQGAIGMQHYTEAPTSDERDVMVNTYGYKPTP